MQIAASALALAWESLWRNLWHVAVVLMFFGAIAMTDILPSWPGIFHGALLVGMVGGIGWLVVANLRGFAWPSRAQARARLEATEPTLHRPLTTVEDRLETGTNDFAAALWATHQARAATLIDRLAATAPSPGVAALDRWSLRSAAVLMLALGLIGAGDDAGPRLVRALTPTLDSNTGTLAAKVWLTPPAYTSRSPMYLEFPITAPTQTGLTVPQGSTVLAVVTGTSRATDLRVDADVFPMTTVGDSSQRIEMRLPDGRRIDLTQRGRSIAGWDLDVLPDLPPEIAFTREPREAGRGRLRVDYRASDDYGIGRAFARIAPGTEIEARVADAFETELSTPPFNPKKAGAATFLDLTAHPLAGMQVVMTLVVVDQADQQSESEAVIVILPERVFNHPVARDLAAMRKSLILDFAGNTKRGARVLDAILKEPEKFGGQPHAILFMSSARGRLALGPSDADARPVADLIWHAAIRIEDGNLVEAEQRLAAAEQALREAMERGATPAEINRLIDQLKQALADFTRELAERMPDSELSALNPEQDSQSISLEDIAAAMERLREMSQMGAKDAARQMMAELENMLQSLRNTANQNDENPEVKAAQDLMRDLREVTEEQSELLEQSFEKAREAALEGRKRDRRQGDAAASERQENLRQRLGDLMGQMGEMTGQIPKDMGGAEQAMRKARDNLKSGAFKPASDAQGEALSALQNSMEQANQQLMQSLAEKGMAGMVPMPGKNRKGFDPTGRRTGPENGENVELPEGPDAAGVSERVRAILEEIRRRAADRTRPPDEQDYLRRLMKQF